MKASNGTSSRKDSPPHAEPRRSGDSSSSTAKRFALSGPSIILDERIHAYRRDIADVALAGQLFAPHYARPMIRGCGARPTFVYGSPSAETPPTSELLPGEQFAALELSGGWAWGYCRQDHYVGYVEAIALIDAPPATHLVTALEGRILPELDASVPHIATLPMGARVTGHEAGNYLATDVGYMAMTDVRPLGTYEEDPVGVAERLVGSPYLLGGRSPRGIDCSGLVQMSLAFCGIPCPRDSDQQRALGSALGEEEAARRGDIILFEGHVGMMVDETQFIHATGHSGAVVVEPLTEVAARNPVIGRRRL